MTKRKQQGYQPVVSESKLLFELREEKRQTQETIAELREVLRSLQEERKKVETVILSIGSSAVPQLIEEAVNAGLAVFHDHLTQTMTDTEKKVETRLLAIASMMTGMPIEAIKSGVGQPHNLLPRGMNHPLLKRS